MTTRWGKFDPLFKRVRTYPKRVRPKAKPSLEKKKGGMKPLFALSPITKTMVPKPVAARHTYDLGATVDEVAALYGWTRSTTKSMLSMGANYEFYLSKKADRQKRWKKRQRELKAGDYNASH